MPILLTETRIDVAKLEVGMRVVRLDRDWEGTDFLIQGFIVQSQNDIESLINQCKHVFIEGRAECREIRPKQKNERRKAPKGLFARCRGSHPTSAQENRQLDQPVENRAVGHEYSYINKISVEKEMFVAQDVYRSAKVTVKNIMQSIRVGRAITMTEAKATVDCVVDSILRNAEALSWLSKIRNKDEYTAEHCLNVCILSATFARHLGFSDSDMRKVALCGLLHDIGKSKIPDEILNKKGRLTDEEFTLMKSHPVFGRDMLLSISQSDRAVIDVAHSHHERIDGQGYPRGLTASQIPYFAKVVAVVDCYDAITSHRCYDSARSSMEALDIIYRGAGKQFDKELAEEFIKCIGIYPPGSIVELTDKRIAIVIANTKTNKLRPRVLIVRNENKQLCPEIIVDLSIKHTRDSTKNTLISKEVPDGTHGVFVAKYVSEGLKLCHSKTDTDLAFFKLPESANAY